MRNKNKEEMGSIRIKTIIMIAISLLTVAILFPTALSILAESDDITTEEITISTTEISKGETYFNQFQKLDSEDYVENMKLVCELEPKSKVDNYFINSALRVDEDGVVSLIFKTDTVVKENNYYFENEILKRKIEGSDNLTGGYTLENVFVDDNDVIGENFEIDNFFDVSDARITSSEEKGGFSSVVKVLLFVLLPIVAVIVVIEMIFNRL